MDSIHLKLPRHAAIVRVIRTVANRAADLAGLGFDRVDDLGLAVDEATAVLLASQGPGSLSVVVDQAPSRVRVELSVEASGGDWPPDDLRDSIGWMVLESVADEVALAASSEAHSIAVTVAAQPA